MKKTKAELEIEINNLKHKLNQADEKLESAGIKKRKTMMSEIIDMENNTLETINYLIKDCEKETGREFPYQVVATYKNIDIKWDSADTQADRTIGCLLFDDFLK